MDILIKNMKKPLQGMYEEIRVWDDGRVDIYDCESESYIPATTAIPVPEHGDLIDRDALREDAKLIQKNDTGFFIDSMSYGEALSRVVDNAEVVLERTT